MVRRVELLKFTLLEAGGSLGPYKILLRLSLPVSLLQKSLNLWGSRDTRLWHRVPVVQPSCQFNRRHGEGPQQTNKTLNADQEGNFLLSSRAEQTRANH